MEQYKCPLCCDKIFTNLIDLKNHLNKASSTVICPACTVSFQDIIALINHLDECHKKQEQHKLSKQLNEKKQTDEEDVMSCDEDDDDDDDEEGGYYCTVCDVEMPDVDQHIKKYHSGQDIILQECEDEEASEIKYSSSRKSMELGNEISQSKHDPKLINEMRKKDVFYCTHCDKAFNSLEQHTSKYHENDNLRVQDLTFNELVPMFNNGDDTIMYRCTGCNTDLQKKSLTQHLNLICENNLPDDKTLIQI